MEEQKENTEVLIIGSYLSLYMSAVVCHRSLRAVLSRSNCGVNCGVM